MTPMTRAEARASGADRYFTGKPCLHGHNSERYTCNAMCVQCSAGYREKGYPKKPATPEQKAKAALRSKEYHAGQPRCRSGQDARAQRQVLPGEQGAHQGSDV